MVNDVEPIGCTAAAPLAIRQSWRQRDAEFLRGCIGQVSLYGLCGKHLGEWTQVGAAKMNERYGTALGRDRWW